MRLDGFLERRPRALELTAVCEERRVALRGGEREEVLRAERGLVVRTELTTVRQLLLPVALLLVRIGEQLDRAQVERVRAAELVRRSRDRARRGFCGVRVHERPAELTLRE